MAAKKKQLNRYEKIIDRLFFAHYEKGMREVEVHRDEIAPIAAKLKIVLPDNLGDVIYSFRYRSQLPENIRKLAASDEEWLIRPAGKSRYKFGLVRKVALASNPSLSKIKVPDATPGIIARYALNDEQALLARLRYNRLVDIFLGITCYSLQNHLRTSVSALGQVETDEVYMGIDRGGAHYVVPVQAKGGRDKLSVVQIEQDLAMCADKFPGLICRPLGAQFSDSGTIVLFELEMTAEGVRIRSERHYLLVPPDELTLEELRSYQLPSGGGHAP